MNTLFLKDIQLKDKPVVGGKAWNLAQLMQLDIPVPNGFVIPSTSFPLDAESTKEIMLKAEELDAQTFAVRSSANIEDSGAYSFAGQFMTQLSVSTSKLCDAIITGAKSTDSMQVHQYLHQNNLDVNSVKMAIIVQKQLNSSVSGVAFSAHPLTGNSDQLVIEGGYGLGELFVSGQATPSTWTIDKHKKKIIDFSPGFQEKKLTIKNGKVQSESIKLDESRSPLTEKQLDTLIIFIQKIEEHFGLPQDIEWAVENGEVFVLQARPITTL